MFNFKNLEDSYYIHVNHFLPDDQCHSYKARIDMKARRIEKDRYRFTLLRRHDVLIDDMKPEYASDLVMMEIGDSLYPIELCVTSTKKIIDIENFEEIKERWSRKQQELLEKSHTFELEQYIKASEKNMKDKQRFYDVLQRDAFIQFYFRPTEKGIMTFDLHNFPKQGYKMMYYAVQYKKRFVSNEDNYSISPAFTDHNIRKTDGTFYCKYAKEGDFLSMELLVNLLMEDNTYYRRKVSLSRDENYDRAVNLWI